MKVLIPMAGLIDVEAEKARLTKDINKRKDEIARIEAKLGNENFTSRAPAAVVDKERKKLEEARNALQSLQEQLQRISKIWTEKSSPRRHKDTKKIYYQVYCLTDKRTTVRKQHIIFTIQQS